MRLLALGFCVFLVLAPGSVRAETVSVELKFSGHLSGQADGTPRSVPKGGTRSYRVWLASWPAAVGESLTVLINNPSPELAYLHKEQLVFSRSNHRKRQAVKVTGVAEGTVTISHAIQDHPSALNLTSPHVTFDVAAGKSQECTYRAVKRHILQRPVDGVFIPGKLDEECAVVSHFTDQQNGESTIYAYPFEVFEYLNDRAYHYSWVLLHVDAGHNIQGINLRFRDAIHTYGHQGNEPLVGSLLTDDLEPGETFWSYFAESRTFRKSTCGFEALESFLPQAYSSATRGDFDGTLLGWDRGCLIDEGRVFSGIMAAQPVTMAVTYQTVVYNLLIERIEIMAGGLRFYIATEGRDSLSSTGYDNQALFAVFPNGAANLDGDTPAGSLDSHGGNYWVAFWQEMGDSLPEIFLPSPFPLE